MWSRRGYEDEPVSGRFTISSLLLLFAISTGTHLITRVNQWRGPMVGDDFLGIRVARMPIRDGILTENVWLVGGGKWRPITTSLLLWLGKWWGYSYRNFQFLNSALLVAIGVTVGFIALRVSGSIVAASVLTAVSEISQFTWMAQTSIYGVMELLSGLFILISAYYAFRAIHIRTRSTPHVICSAVLLFMATLTHERFLICSLVFSLCFLLQGQSKELKRRAWIPLLPALFYFATRTFILNLDPLAGGGESSLRTQGGFWIGSHLLDAVQMLFGGFSGLGVYYIPNAITVNRSRDDLGLLQVLGTVSVLVCVAISGRLRGDDDRTMSDSRSKVTPIMFLTLSVTCLVPAATVFERIEGRWLYVPQLLLLLAILDWTRRLRRTHRLVRNIAFPMLMGALALYYRPDASNYLKFRDKPSEIVSVIENNAPTVGPWVLIISQSDRSVPTEWQFGYGNVFEQLTNPPYLTDIATGKENTCPMLKRRIPCLVVRLEGLGLPRQVRKTLTQVTSIARGD